MIQLLDGPCAGDYLVKRAPMFLRAVLDPRTGEKDLLDLVDDKPKQKEKIYVYQLEGRAGWIHLKMTSRSQSGYYALGKYKYLPDIDGELVRDTAAWQAWATKHLSEITVTCPVDGLLCDKVIKDCHACERGVKKEEGKSEQFKKSAATTDTPVEDEQVRTPADGREPLRGKSTSD